MGQSKPPEAWTAIELRLNTIDPQSQNQKAGAKRGMEAVLSGPDRWRSGRAMERPQAIGGIGITMHKKSHGRELVRLWGVGEMGGPTQGIWWILAIQKTASRNRRARGPNQMNVHL